MLVSVAPLASNTPTCEITGVGANSAWHERGGGVEDSGVELRPDDNALRSAFLGDFRIALKEDMMDRVEKARKHCVTRYLLVFKRSKTASFYLSLCSSYFHTSDLLGTPQPVNFG